LCNLDTTKEKVKRMEDKIFCFMMYCQSVSLGLKQGRKEGTEWRVVIRFKLKKNIVDNCFMEYCG